MLQFITEALIALRERQEGQAMVEYALILGLISVVAIGALTLIGGDVNRILGQVEAALPPVLGREGTDAGQPFRSRRTRGSLRRPGARRVHARARLGHRGRDGDP